MLNSNQLRRLIQKILNSELTGSDLNMFIRFCTSLSAAFLLARKKAGKLYLEFANTDETHIRQLALDSIAELFARDSQNNFYKLQKYYKPLEKQILAEVDEALFMTRRLIVAHTKQSLAKVFTQNDPSGAKIYRNLSLVTKRDTDIRKVQYGHENYLYLWDQNMPHTFPDDLNPEKPEIDWDAGLQILTTIGKKVQPMPETVRGFLHILKSESTYRHFISRILLFNLLKHNKGISTVSVENYSFLKTLNHSDKMGVTESDQDRFYETVKVFIRSHIESRFVGKSKILSAEAQVYTNILDQYFQDLLMDGVAGKLPEYKLRSGFKEMETDVWKIHRGRLEYLIRLSREELKTRFQYEFLNYEKMNLEER